jgi:hypothetical protein
MSKLITVLFVVGCFTNLFSQTKKPDLTSDKRMSFIMVGSDYSSNVNSLGRVNDINPQPSLSAYASWFSAYNFDVSMTGYNVWNSDSSYTHPTQELDLVIGYTLPITKWLEARSSYSKYFYSDGSNSIRSGYSNLIDLTLSSEVKWWWLDAGCGYTFGGIEEFYSSAQTGVTIEFDNLFHRNHMLTLQPSFDVLFSNIDYYDLNMMQDYWFLYNYGEKNPDGTIADLYKDLASPTTPNVRVLKSFLTKHPVIAKRMQQLPADLVVSDIFEPNRSFELSTIGFTLPVYYSINNFDINLVYSIYKPVNQPSYVDASWINYMSLGASYLFGW